MTQMQATVMVAPMKTSNIAEKPRQRKGFAVMSRAQRTRIAAMGGRKTAKKLGKKYMATIGRRGRLLRAARERLEKKKIAA